MKELWKRIIFAGVLFLFIIGMLNYSLARRNITIQTLETQQMKEAGLVLWYTDENMTAYLTEAAAEFSEQFSTTVDVKLVGSSDYLNNVAQSSVTKEAVTPDLFVAKNTLLEEIYEAGLAVENTSDKFSEKDFAKTALNSVTYHNKKIAYPLCFHTSCLVYRCDLIEKPQNIDWLINCDVSQVTEVAIEKNTDINTGDVLSDFCFVGNSILLGAENGDDSQKVSVDRNLLNFGVSFFRDMNAFCGTVPYAVEESMIAGYTAGKNLSIILNTDYLGTLYSSAQQSDVQYDIIKVPPLTDYFDSKTASYTDTVVVNGMSDKTILARSFAEFITYDYVDNLYDKSGLYPAKKVTNIQDFDKIYEIYQNSESFPKFLETQDLTLKIGQLFEDVAGGSDVDAAVERFAGTIEKRFETE